jgi:hypothetical protein
VRQRVQRVRARLWQLGAQLLLWLWLSLRGIRLLSRLRLIPLLPLLLLLLPRLRLMPLLLLLLLLRWKLLLLLLLLSQLRRIPLLLLLVRLRLPLVAVRTEAAALQEVMSAACCMEAAAPYMYRCVQQLPAQHTQPAWQALVTCPAVCCCPQVVVWQRRLQAPREGVLAIIDHRLRHLQKPLPLTLCGERPCRCCSLARCCPLPCMKARRAGVHPVGVHPSCNIRSCEPARSCKAPLHHALK